MTRLLNFHPKRLEVVLFVISGDDLFITPCRIDCSVEEYCVLSGTDRALMLERVYERDLVDV